jgi:pimeloyl-ACP methyl ester carboxylesterase
MSQLDRLPWPASLEQRFFDIDGAPARVLTVDADAAAPTLVLIQPGGAVPEVFLPLITRLAGKARIIAPDLPGHGTTAYRRAPGAGPHATLREHVSRVLDAMAVGPCVVAGSSLGAHVTVSLALREPERTRAVVVFGSASTFASEAELEQVVLRHNRLSAAIPEPASLRAARASLRRFIDVHDDELSDAMVWAQSVSRTLPAVMQSSALLFADLVDRDLVRPDLVAHRLGEVHQPVLVIWGRQDQGADVRFAVDGVGRLPRGSLVVLEQCGHLPYLEHPDEVAQLVLAHLARTGDSPAK